jgi:hypothetical protein
MQADVTETRRASFSMQNCPVLVLVTGPARSAHSAYSWLSTKPGTMLCFTGKIKVIFQKRSCPADAQSQVDRMAETIRYRARMCSSSDHGALAQRIPMPRMRRIKASPIASRPLYHNVHIVVTRSR